MMKKSQAWFAGPAPAVAEKLAGYADAGLTHFVIRFTGDHERQLGGTRRHPRSGGLVVVPRIQPGTPRIAVVEKLP